MGKRWRWQPPLTCLLPCMLDLCAGSSHSSLALFHALHTLRHKQAAFGPFYRITQLILTTTPAANSSGATPSGLPAIVTDAHIRLLFDMQAEIDALVAEMPAGSGGSAGSSSDGGGYNGIGSGRVTLADVCLRPLGTACATQSVLQYWGMSLEAYQAGEPLTLPGTSHGLARRLSGHAAC